MFDEYTLFFVPQKVGISYKGTKSLRDGLPGLWRSFYVPLNKSSGKIFRNTVLLSYHTKQSNTETSTAYEYNNIFWCLPQPEL